MEKNNILNNVQCGFRKGRSTIDHTIRLQDAINKYCNNRPKGQLILSEFSLIFSRILIMMWRSGLLIKLKNPEITSNILVT